jgi:phosphate starvation-inducible PhoH-like protein
MGKQRQRNRNSRNIDNDDSKILNLNRNPVPVVNLKDIRPKTANQERAFESYREGRNIVFTGYAGTGKSLLALGFSLDAVFKKKSHKHIRIIRSTISCRDFGFLPGDAESKCEPYSFIYESIFDKLIYDHPTLNGNPYKALIKSDTVSFSPTAFLRGDTFDDEIIVCEEFSNMNFAEISTIMGRIGTNTRIFVTGDYLQTDLNYNPRDVTGFHRAVEGFKHMSSIDIIDFEISDILRSEFVKEWILATT